MTREMLKQGQDMLDEIKQLQEIVGSLNRTLRDTQPKKKWMIRFTNGKQDKPGEPKKAGIFLFDGVSVYGLDIPTEEGLVTVIRDYFQKRLDDTKTEFENLGSLSS